MTINQLINWIGNRTLPQVIGGAFAAIVLTWCGFALWGTAAHAIESTSVDAKVERINDDLQAQLEADNREAKRRWANVNRAFLDVNVSQERYAEMLANTDPTNQNAELTPRELQLIDKRQQWLESNRRVRALQAELGY